MNTRYTDFIGMYDEVFPDYYCQHMISEFERIGEKGHCRNRQEFEGTNKTSKQDNFLFLNVRNHSGELSNFNEMSSIKIFWEGLQNCFDEYSSEFDILKDSNLMSTSIKMQKTSPGEGYHIWHSEQGNGPSNESRGLVYMIYLNTLDDNSAGETEFLYQRIRIPPKENTMLIWPASFTHAHRGNLVHGNKSKYVITGWFNY